MKKAETLPVAEPLLFLAAGDPLPESGGFKPKGGKINAGQLSYLLRRAS